MSILRSCIQCGESFVVTGGLRPNWKHCSVACKKKTTHANRGRLVSLERLREEIHYDSASGEFSRRKHQHGSSVGWCDELGYLHIRVATKLYLAHRLAWLYVYERWPSSNLDHINGIPSDNRICNLREATQQQNTRNAKAVRSNSSIRAGVNFDKNRQKFRAYITIGKKQKYLGRFSTIEAALAARNAAEVQHFGEYRRQV